MLSNAEHNFIRSQLALYGLSEREVKIYLQSLSIGPASIQTIATKLGENRITTHSACAQLVKKGVLFETRKGHRRLLAAEDPETLQRLLAIKERELDNARANLGYAIRLLQRQHDPERKQPKIAFHEGVDGFKRMLEMSLSAHGEFLGLINVELFSQHLTPKYLEDFFIQRANQGIFSRLIWPETAPFAEKTISRSRELKIQVRTLPTSTPWSSGFISWNDCISLKSFSAGQITCTIIQNEDIVSFYRNVIFEALWQTAKPLKLN